MAAQRAWLVRWTHRQLGQVVWKKRGMVNPVYCLVSAVCSGAAASCSYARPPARSLARAYDVFSTVCDMLNPSLGFVGCARGWVEISGHSAEGSQLGARGGARRLGGDLDSLNRSAIDLIGFRPAVPEGEVHGDYELAHHVGARGRGDVPPQLPPEAAREYKAEEGCARSYE